MPNHSIEHWKSISITCQGHYSMLGAFYIHLLSLSPALACRSPLQSLAVIEKSAPNAYYMWIDKELNTKKKRPNEIHTKMELTIHKKRQRLPWDSLNASPSLPHMTIRRMPSSVHCSLLSNETTINIARCPIAYDLRKSSLYSLLQRHFLLK